MKVTTSDNANNFSPVTINITFESEDELMSLWHRCNLNYLSVQEITGSGHKTKCLDDSRTSNFGLWNTLDTIRTDKGIRI